MNYSMDVVDELVRRKKVTYRVAKEALDASGGNLLGAIIYLEENAKNNVPQDLPRIYLDKIKNWIDEGMISQVQIRKNGQTLFDIPLPVGIVGAAMWRLPALLFLGAALSTHCDIRIVRRDGASCQFTDITIDKVREIIQFVGNEIRKRNSKGSDCCAHEVDHE
ncbi:MAG: DUF4342 domain-containing protein [Bacillota bacterium]|nr:DUF4342 domain-containing protein [Bacillota bacterium]